MSCAKPLFRLLTLGLLVAATSASAQWQLDGSAVCTTWADQTHPAIVSDGAGGAIVTWYDNRSTNQDIYAQRINASGVVQWTANGVALCIAAGDQYFPTIVSDGAGGAIVTWYDTRSGTNQDIYAQRINASGAVQWTANGVALCTAAADQYYPTIVSDGAGGAIVTWFDGRNGNNDIYAQRINSSGVIQWTANGVALCTAINSQQNPTIVPDGGGGAIVTWEDYRIGTADIYTQRISTSGVVQWVANGVALCTAANNQQTPVIISDGAGGAIVTWQDQRLGPGADIYAQRINASGVVQWTADGVALCAAASFQYNPTLVSDGAGGAIVTWQDYRTGTTWDVYAQRVNALGANQWTADGVAIVTTTPNEQVYPTIASDGAGGAIVAWEDYGSNPGDIYVQRISSGAVQWTPNGVALCTAAGDQIYPKIVSSAGGAIVTWFENRSSNSDIYAQRVDAVYGYWGHPEPVVASVADIPHDQGGKVAVNWTASGRDRPVPATIDYYSIWRAVDVAPLNASASSSLAITPLDAVDLDTPLGVHTTTSNSSYYWELVGMQTAFRWPDYSFSADTRADSVAGAVSNAFYMVAAHERTDQHIAFPSNVLSGHSVDNLAPPAPLYLTAQRVGGIVNLKWNGVHVPDIRNYTVYRKTSTGVTPVPANFLADDNDTLLTDSTAPAGALYYVVTARDVHENQGTASNEAGVGATTNVGNLPPITALTVLQNHPNPFTEATGLDVGLPASGQITIGVFDVAGRRVRELTSAGTRGWQHVSLSAIDGEGRPLASGVYFYRVRAGNETVTRKMLIMR